MLTIQGKPGRLCDGPARRELLTIGGLGLIGLHLPTVLYRQAFAEENSHRASADAENVGPADGIIGRLAIRVLLPAEAFGLELCTGNPTSTARTRRPTLSIRMT